MEVKLFMLDTNTAGYIIKGKDTTYRPLGPVTSSEYFSSC